MGAFLKNAFVGLVLIGIGLVRGFDAGFEWTSWLLLGLGALIVLLRTLVARGR